MENLDHTSEKLFEMVPSDSPLDKSAALVLPEDFPPCPLQPGGESHISKSRLLTIKTQNLPGGVHFLQMVPGFCPA
jgi:hypothetical protein